jgi:protein TonB
MEIPSSIFFIPVVPIEKIKNEDMETNIAILKETPVILNAEDIIVMKILEEHPIIENVLYTMIQNAPVFIGCEGLSSEENRLCFDIQMKRFVQRNFDVNVANDLGLNAEKYN